MSKKISTENRKADDKWKAAIRKRDVHCVICGKGLALGEGFKAPRLNAHHLIPKEFKDYRWDLDNGMLLCVHHHTLGKLSAHKNPLWFVMWMRKYQRAKLGWMWAIMRESV